MSMSIKSLPGFSSFFGQPVVRGLMGRCPKCGEGKMFRAFLKVADTCPHCGEELFHQRADDFPAYCVIFVVGHVVVTAALVIETEFAPSLWLQAAIWVPLTFALSIALLQPFKGAIVALQWSAGMHGFERAKHIRDAEAARLIADGAGRLA